LRKKPYETNNVPFARSYWVVTGKLLAGYYPGDTIVIEMEKKLRSLLAVGIRYTINLMEDAEHNWSGNLFTPYHPYLTQYAQEIGAEIVCTRHPIRDMGVPAREEMSDILNEIDLAIENNKPVYVHCLGGKGRTGTVVGCFLMRHGIATESTVLQMVQRLRRDDPESHIPSPQSIAQQQMIMNWIKGE